MSTSTTGTGTITLGSAVSGFQTFADAGITNGQTVRYAIDDGANFEIGSGTYTSSGTTLTRSVTESSNSDSAISLSGSAEVFIAATVADLNPLYAANPSSATSPTASGTNAVAIGDGAASAGLRALAAGRNSTASGDYSTALGNGATASGEISTSLGSYATASGQYSTAIGLGNGGGGAAAVASGTGSMALGGSKASGTESLAGAIGNNTSSYGASGDYSVAIGRQAKASGTGSAALGNLVNATATYSSIVGYASTASANYASVFGGRSNTASATYASVIGGYANTSSGNGSIATGFANTASGAYALAGGYGCTASNASAFAFGNTSVASGANSVSIGHTSTASHEKAFAIGDNVQSTATNQINLGGTADTVRISEGYTLPTADGSANQVLTTNGSGAVSFADAGGGFDSDITIDGKTANYTIVAGDAGKIISHSSNDVTFTFTAAATLGAGWHCWVKNRAGATNVTTFDFNGSENLDGIGNGKLFTGESIHVYCDGSNFHSVDRTIMWAGNTATDYYAQPIAQGGGSIAGGLQSNASGTTSVALGFSTTASHTNSSAIGYGSIAASTRAMALGWSRAGGTESLSAQIGTSSSSYGATGANSVAIGRLSKATDADSFAIGDNNVVSNGNAFALGNTNTVSGNTAIAIGESHTVSGTYGASIGGYGSTATQTYAMTFGPYAKAAVQNAFIFGSKGWFSAGSAQGGMYILYADTTDATAEALTTTNSTAGSTNQIVAASDTCITFHGTITAMQNGAQAYGGWEIKGMLVNDGGTTSLALGNISDMAANNASSWAVALSADNTNNALKIQVTGEASHNIRWVANVQTAEVTYA